MKKNFFLLLLGFSLVACNSNKTDKGNESAIKITKPQPPKHEGPIRVLFVGNSHTESIVSYPMLLDALCKANGKQVEIYTLVEMGVSIDKILEAHKSEADELFGKKDSDGNFLDYVIVQESTPVAAEEVEHFSKEAKTIHELVTKNSPNIATYIYELAAPVDCSDTDYEEMQKLLSDNVAKVAKETPNAGILNFATVLRSAYEGKEGYVAIKDGKDLLRNTDGSKHVLNDAGFMNSVVLYQYLFGETPKIPQQLPLATGTGDQDEIKDLDVSTAISNSQALLKIAGLYK